MQICYYNINEKYAFLHTKSLTRGIEPTLLTLPKDSITPTKEGVRKEEARYEKTLKPNPLIFQDYI